MRNNDDRKDLKGGTHVRITSGRYRGCLGTINAVEKDPNGTDYFVEMINDALWFRWWDVEPIETYA